MSERPFPDSDLTPEERPLYPADRAFVVEIQRDAAVTAGLCVGRIEHISSGAVARFTDVDTLLRFLAEAHVAESAAHNSKRPSSAE